MEIPSISAKSAAKSHEYLKFLWLVYNQGIKGNPSNAKEYAEDVARLARPYHQLAVEWEGTATIIDVTDKKGFKESMVKIVFPLPSYAESDGKLVEILVNHNDWSRKIRPGTRVTAKAFIEDIRFKGVEYIVVLSQITLVSRQP